MAIKTRKKGKYSKKELEEFKKLIGQKLGKAYSEYEVFKGNISGDDDHGTNDTSPTFKVLEEGSEVLSKEENAQLAVRQRKFIQHLENALLRIENGSYGICRVTGNLISKERLRAVPHATLSIDAKKAQ
jgi:RNA polymerase-binding transcription factor DksA